MLNIVRLGAAAALVFASSWALAQAQSSDITLKVSSPGGPPTDIRKKYTASLFTLRTGIKVQFIDGNNPDHLAKLIASKGRTPPYDVVMFDRSSQGDAIRQGVLQKLDPKLVPNLKDIYPQALRSDGYGPVYHTLQRGIIFNAAKFKEAGIPEPTSWLDLWDPRLAGKVTVPHLTQANGPGFLIQINRVVGGTEANVEPGIRKIAELKVHSYYTSTVQTEALVSSGEVWAANIPSGRAWGLIDKGLPVKFVVPKEGSVGNLSTVDVVANTPYPKEAQAFVNAVLDPLSQLGTAFELSYGPVTRLLEPALAAHPEISKRFPANEKEFAQIFEPDWDQYARRHRAALDLWNRIVRQ